jgi:ferredoxin-type protein NapF
MSGQRFDPSRRRWLLGRRAAPAPLRPPWARLEGFTDACTRCGACLDACPEAILVPGDGGFPEVDFRRGGCSFCGACAELCPEPVFDFDASRPWDLAAAVGEGCLAGKGVFCQLCADICDRRAIAFVPRLRSAPQPRIDPAACTGCGACVAACPAEALSLGRIPAPEAAHGG